ncbi:AAA family ATPase [Oceanospirillum maris]|uniref:AAA family ATPase n=1 Tax=Oceanospirillum maris TaxID=64977 RepID=UPI00040BD7E4|nr:AAA family ATPase [Oceanospirillum maris]
MPGDNFSFTNITPSVTDGVVEESLFFPSQQHAQVIELIGHLSRYSSLLLTITGPQGSGKSLIKRKVLEGMDAGVQISELNTEQVIQPQPFMQALNQSLDLGLDSNSDLNQYLLRLKQHFGQLHREGNSSLIIVDDAHLLSPETLELMVILLSDDDDQKRPHILLLGETSLIEVLQGSRLKERFNAIGHHLALQPLTTEESWSYLEYRLSAAGLLDQISEHQKADIIRAGGGVPGQINAMANLALSDPAGLKKVASISPKASAQPKADKKPSPRAQRKAAANAADKPAKAKRASIPLWHVAALSIVAALLGAAYLYQDELMSMQSEPEIAENTPLTDLNRLSRPTEETLAEAEEAAAKIAESEEEQAITIIKPVYPDDEPVSDDQSKRDADAALLGMDTAPAKTVAVPETTQAPDKPESAEKTTTPKAEPTKETAAASTPEKPTEKPAVKEKPPVKETPIAKEKTAPAKPSSPYKQENELLALKSNLYTLQLLGSHIEANAIRFIDGLSSKKDVHYFETIYQNKPWFVVIYGKFDNRDAAIASIPALAKPLKDRKPWARSMASVQSDIRKK